MNTKQSLTQAERSARHYAKHRESVIKKNAAIQARRIKTDQQYALQRRIKDLVNQSIKSAGLSKKSRTAQILGCSPAEFKRHIELQFLPGMSWEKKSEWHIDHIVPVSSATCEEELVALNHYTNLRPLWADKNLQKGSARTHLI
jgi:hypothetical protein